jgi:hypothetical protein
VVPASLFQTRERAQTPPSNNRHATTPRENVLGVFEEGKTMRRSVRAGFLAAVAGAMLMPHCEPARAQDVQSRCARIGNDDRVRPIPDSFVPQARRLFEISADTPSAFIRKTTTFRCMKGKVWLCNYGANLTCGKANVSRTSTGAAEFCQQNPGSDVVPMAATGHDTIYDWKCVGSKAQTSRQIATVDPRGFIARNWKELQ